MFEILEFTEARLASLTTRVEKHGDEDKPAISMGLEITAANTLLDAIDPKLRHSLYMAKPDEEPELPEMEQVTPILRCNSLERSLLTAKYEGWTLQVDDGADETLPMVFGAVKVDKFSVEAKQGGSVVLRFRTGTSDIDADKLGKLGMHKGQSIWIALVAPKQKEDAIDGTVGHPGLAGNEPTAEDLFAEEHGGPRGAFDDPEDEDEGGIDVDEGVTDDAPVIEQSQPGTRTARGRSKTKAALEAGQE